MSAPLQNGEESGLKMRDAEARASQMAGELVSDLGGSGQHVPDRPMSSPLANVQWPEPKGAEPDGRPPMVRVAQRPGRTQGGQAGEARCHDGGSSGPEVMMVGAGPVSPAAGVLRLISRLPRLALRVPILVYRYTLSSFMGRQCRYLPTCSAYADEAISRHGAWPGLFMTTARICRCHPWGGDGFDPVPQCLPVRGRWYAPWRYGLWRMPPSPVTETGEGAGRDRTVETETN